MMRVSFPYPWCGELEVPEEALIGVFAPRVSAVHREEETVAEALANPIGTAPLRELVRPGQHVVIICDDNTRQTPIPLLLSPVVAEFNAAGIPDENIDLLVAYGTHRVMSEDEKRAKLGPEALSRFRVLDHDARDPGQLTCLGRTSRGFEVWVNKAVVEADFVLALGHIVPHRVAGFSGGAKAVQPGVCGELTTGLTHWLSSSYPNREILGRPENPIRLEMEQIARRAGLKFIVNVVQDSRDRVAACVAGDPILAHRAGCEASRRLLGVKISEVADIVICDSYPADLDFWQANKALFAADLAIRDGGVIILVTPCPEGVSPRHPELLDYGYRPYAEIKQLVESGTLQDLTLAANLSGVGMVVAERTTCIVVSPGLDPGACRRLNLVPADTPAEALELAWKRVGRQSRIAVLQHAAELLPIMEGA